MIAVGTTLEWPNKTPSSDAIHMQLTNDVLMLRLDYISCGLTISSTILVGRKRWQGWIVAALNSVLICFIGWNTSQLGFIPANVFCLALYAYNLREWSKVSLPEN